MKTRGSKTENGRWFGTLLLLISVFSFQLSAFSQSYAINWFTIDGGGGTSTNERYSVSGTIGQPGAGTMSAGNYTLQGGFWSLVSVVQTPGAPWLSLTRSNGVVTVSWPKPAEGWILECCTYLTSRIWTQIPPPYATNATDCYVTEPSPSGNRFYRLHKP